MSASLKCVCVSSKKYKTRGQRLDRIGGTGELESVQTLVPAQPPDDVQGVTAVYQPEMRQSHGLFLEYQNNGLKRP